MGSRTGATYTSIVGRSKTPNSRALTKSIGNLSQSLNNGSIQVDATLSKQEFEMSAKIALGILIQSHPALSVVYNAIYYTEKIIGWYPEIKAAYIREGEAGVAKVLMQKALEIEIGQGVNMIVGEIADQTWISLKTKMELNTTPNEDQIAKLIINYMFNLAIESARENKPSIEEFVSKQVANAAFEYFVDSIIESKGDGHPNEANRYPCHDFFEMSPEKMKILREAVKEVTKEIATEYCNRWHEQWTVEPDTARERLVSIVREKYPTLDIDEEIYESPDSFSLKNVIFTDQDRVRRVRNSLILTTSSMINGLPVNDRKNIIGLNFKIGEGELSPEEKDLANFAAFLVGMEYYIRQDFESSKNILPKKVIFYAHSDIDNGTKLIMEQLAAFLLDYSPKFRIIKIIESPEPRNEEESREEIGTVCLFSGGLDSVAGYLGARAISEYGRIKLVFVYHNNPKSSFAVKQLVSDLSIGNNDLLTVTSPTGGRYLQQTRGFLFLTAAVIHAHRLSAKRVVVAECGVTQYQPNITIADEITRTTHPLMINLADALFKKKGVDVKIVMPFNDLTKAEIIAAYKENANYFKNTHSCRSQTIYDETSYKTKVECGYCFGCLIKNIGLTYILGKRQNQFSLDPLKRNRTYKTLHLDKPSKLDYNKMESIKSLIGFTSSVLRGDETIHQTTKEGIKAYHKENLFKRFSEDIIYGLSYMKQKGWIKNKEILGKLTSIEAESSWFKLDRVNERRAELIRQDEKPSWPTD